MLKLTQRPNVDGPKNLNSEQINILKGGRPGLNKCDYYYSWLDSGYIIPKDLCDDCTIDQITPSKRESFGSGVGTIMTNHTT